jgi:hypothetical protein
MVFCLLCIHSQIAVGNSKFKSILQGCTPEGSATLQNLSLQKSAAGELLQRQVLNLELLFCGLLSAFIGTVALF